MATTTAIRGVREMLGPDAAEAGWTDARISSDLDAKLSPNTIAYQWWRHRSATTYKLTQVSESGSSRTLAQIHDHAVAMRNYYQGLVDKENDPTPPDDNPKRGPGIRTFAIRRIARS